MKTMDIGRLVGKKWNEQTEDEKQQYKKIAKKQKLDR